MRFRTGQHLRRQGDIRAVRQDGVRTDAGAFTIWWTADPAKANLRRACFVASTQAVGPAVSRNRAKRRLREIFRKHQELLPSACDLLVVARRSVNQWPFSRVEQAFVSASGRIRPTPPNP